MAAPTPNPHNVNDANDQLRRRANRRLLGASLLLLVAIIAVPMFLERDPPPLPDSVNVRIPSIEGTKLEPRFPEAGKGAATRRDEPAVAASEVNEPSDAQASIAAAGAAPRPTAPLPPAASKSTPAKSPEPAPEKVMPKAAEKAPAKVAEKQPEKAPEKSPEKAPAKVAEKTPEKAPEAAVAKKSGQLVVQLIAVRDADAAKEIADRAKSLRLPTYSERITVENGIVTRVRVGPFDTRQQAEAARARLAQQGFEAKVLTLP